MSRYTWTEFKPPDKGLNEGESVVWEQKAGVSFVLMWCAGCLPLLSFFMAFFIVFWVGEQLGTVILAGDGFVILYLFYLVIQSKRTTYYLTTQRLVEARGGALQKEIKLENLRGLPPEEFMRAGISHEDAYDYYNITFTDSISGNRIRMTAIREDVYEKLKKSVEAQ